MLITYIQHYFDPKMLFIFAIHIACCHKDCNTKQAPYQTFKIALIFAQKPSIYRKLFNYVIDKGDRIVSKIDRGV